VSPVGPSGGSSSFIDGTGTASSTSPPLAPSPSNGSFGQASPRTLAIDTVVVSLATRITQTPSPTINSDASPTMNSVKRSWYLLLIKRFLQRRL
jgi:hypothetical protein